MDFFGILFDMKNGKKVPYSKTYFDTLFAAKLAEMQIKTLTGTLPLTFVTNENHLRNWRIDGNNNIGKNLVDLRNVTDSTSGGVTFTVDSANGTITANRTATDTDNSTKTFRMTLPAGTYVFSCGENSQRDITYDCYLRADNVTIARDNPDDPPGSEFTLTTETTFTFYISIQRSYNAQNLVFRPMIRPANTSAEFEPYQIGVGQRTKNYAKVETGSTEAGVTFTFDPVAGTVTANGTATRDAQCRVYFNNPGQPNNSTVPPGNYYFSGCPSGGSGSKYDCYSWDYDTYERSKKWDGTTNVDSDFGRGNCQVKINGHKQSITMRIKSGYTADNVVFKPMLRAADTDAEFIPFGYEIPLAVTCDRNLFNIYGNMAYSGGVHLIDYNVETSSVTGEMPANSFFQLGFQNAILKGDETFVISFDKTTAGTAELRIVKGEGSAQEIIETFDISAIKSYRVVFECEESFGNVYPRLVATEAATQTFEHIMIKKASDKGGFVPYGAKYEYNVLIDAPLTEGQSITDTQTISTFEGENVLDTTLENKPQMTITYKGG